MAMRPFIFALLFGIFSVIPGKAIYFCGSCYDFYVGVTGGLGFLSGNFESQALSGETHDHSSSQSFGIVGGVLGMQTYICDDLFFAVQTNFLYNRINDLKKLDTAEGSRNFEVSLKNYFQGGFDARFGLRFCGTTPYVLFGVEAGRFARELNNESAISSRGVPAHGKISRTQCLWGPKVGAGITFPIDCHLWLNFEYDYTWVGSIVDSLTDPVTQETWHHRDKIRQSSLLGGINFIY